VVEANSDDDQGDWLQLSRKHEIEIDRDRGVVSIFGGKLTDCLNVGEEVVDALAQLGISNNGLDESWFGEPSVAEHSRFMARVEAGKVVDSQTAATLWRRYGRRADYVLARVHEDPSLGEVLWDEPRYIKAEIIEIGEHEMVARVDDFLRRRTSLSLTEHGAELEDRIPEFSELLGLADQ